MSWWIVILLSTVNAHAHSNLKVNGNIPPRSADTGLKVAPCGNIARTSSSKQFVAGSTVSVDWQETIDHPGHFEFYFSPAGDANWVLLKSVVDTQGSTVPLPHSYTTMVTLPNVSCDACTFQLVQVMEENPAMPTNYYSCGDIKLVQAGQLSPTPTPSPVPPSVPAPAPAPSSTGNSCPH